MILHVWCQFSGVDGHVICCELQYACPGAATVSVQVRLKKEVLDESIRGNAKQRALVGAASLNGDQWYVQQASRSARTRITHALLACHSRSHTLRSTLFILGHLSDLHKDTWPAFTLSLHASATSDSCCVTFCSAPCKLLMATALNGPSQHKHFSRGYLQSSRHHGSAHVCVVGLQSSESGHGASDQAPARLRRHHHV